jgi:hypothetical protein
MATFRDKDGSLCRNPLLANDMVEAALLAEQLSQGSSLLEITEEIPTPHPTPLKEESHLRLVGNKPEYLVEGLITVKVQTRVKAPSREEAMVQVEDRPVHFPTPYHSAVEFKWVPENQNEAKKRVQIHQVTLDEDG